LEPVEDWPAEGKSAAGLQPYTFPVGPSKYFELAPTYRKSAAEHADPASLVGLGFARDCMTAELMLVAAATARPRRPDRVRPARRDGGAKSTSRASACRDQMTGHAQDRTHEAAFT
jgi:hypothetical protein